MELELVTPLEKTHIKGVDKVMAEGPDGMFTILPRHANYATSLSASILSYKAEDTDGFWGVDEGVLTKTGGKVVASVRQAIKGASLDDLKAQIEKEFKMLDDEEKKARTALASLQLNISKMIAELRHG